MLRMPALKKLCSTSLRKLIPSAYSRIGFDPAWYLSQYPDIAAAGIDPWRHFFRHGYAEGRLPNAACARLWSERDASVVPTLRRLLKPGLRSPESDFAAWTLGRWFARDSKWAQAFEVMQVLMTLESTRLTQPLATKLLWIDVLLRSGQFDSALHALERWLNEAPSKNDFRLAYANLEKFRMRGRTTALKHAVMWLDQVNRIYSAQGLMPLAMDDPNQPISMDNLRGDGYRSDLTHNPSACLDPHSSRPLVSIIVPAFNAESTLPTALRSLQMQTWEALEILVVDDASTDATAEIVRAFSQSDPRIRLAIHACNQGTYAARNTGLSLVTGEYITVHDSDDWSHPQKIEHQALALLVAPKTMVSVSHWVRSSSDLEYGGWQTPEGWTGWIHRNVSSLMMRRSVFEQLGFWDRVKCSGDTEYYYRVIRAFGLNAIEEVLPGTPLSFGRFHEASITQHAETNIFTIFGGVRKQYHDAFRLWHDHSKDTAELFLAREPVVRKFLVPLSILPKAHSK